MDLRICVKFVLDWEIIEKSLYITILIIANYYQNCPPKGDKSKNSFTLNDYIALY